MARDKNIDKYLKLSDKLVYLYHQKDDFLKKFGAAPDSDPEVIIDTEVRKMLLNI